MKKRYKFNSKLLEIRQLTPTVREFVFKTPEELHFEGGQFMTFRFEREGRQYGRPYSIASANHQRGKMDFLIKLVEGGKFTPWLFKKKVGETLELRGPMGNFTLKAPHQAAAQSLVFIATGTGVAPFKSMLESLLQAGSRQRLTLLTGVRVEEERLYAARWEALTRRHPQLIYENTLSRPKSREYQGAVGRVDQLVRKHLPENRESVFFLCGLKAMITDLTNLLYEAGISKERVFFERYD